MDERHYRVIETLGEGGFGTVYRAELVSAGGFTKQVALKVLRADKELHDEVTQRLRDEARMLGHIRHRAIVGVDGLAHLDEGWAVVMEFIDGVDAKELLASSPVPARAALEIIEEAASALHAAYHARPLGSAGPLRLIHRDIKPANIRVTPAGEVKVLDFGVARADFASREAETRSMMYGTLSYMAPERLEGDDGPEADVFALGWVLVDLLLGDDRKASVPLVPNKYKAAIEDRVRRLTEIQAAHEPEITEAERATLVQLIRAMTAFNVEDRPSARDVERQCRTLKASIPGPWLRDWAEDTVPALRLARYGAQADNASGRLLKAHNDSVAWIREEGSATPRPSFETPRPSFETPRPAPLPVEPSPPVESTIALEPEPAPVEPVVPEPEPEPDTLQEVDTAQEPLPVVDPAPDAVELLPVVEETLVEETPIEETPIEETPIEETPVEPSAPDETPATDEPADEAVEPPTEVEEPPTEVEEPPTEIDEPAQAETAVAEPAPVEPAPVEQTSVEPAPAEPVAAIVPPAAAAPTAPSKPPPPPTPAPLTVPPPRSKAPLIGVAIAVAVALFVALGGKDDPQAPPAEPTPAPASPAEIAPAPGPSIAPTEPAPTAPADEPAPSPSVTPTEPAANPTAAPQGASAVKSKTRARSTPTTTEAAPAEPVEDEPPPVVEAPTTPTTDDKSTGRRREKAADPTGMVEFAGDAWEVRLVAKGKEYGSGQVPAGSYKIRAVFNGAAPVEAGSVTVVSGETRRVSCSASTQKCTAR